MDPKIEDKIKVQTRPETGMPPVVGVGPRVLILGSMPGERSLQAKQYYAHPTNAFWPILRELLGAPDGASYQARLRALKANKVALWDVVHSCRRRGSLDSNIEEPTIVLNNFEGFLSKHPTIRAIAFNGKKAEKLFLRGIAPKLPETIGNIELIVLPSTSAAHASISRESKLGIWRVLLDSLSD